MNEHHHSLHEREHGPREAAQDREQEHRHHGGRGDGHRHHHGGGPERGPHGRGHHGGGHDGGHREGGHFGGPRGRARRGEARTIVLDALKDGPRHGYEIIKALEERSSGQYAPSAGTIYPTLQHLEDLGLVRAEQDADRRVYALTDEGKADLAARAQEVADFWARFTPPTVTASNLAEIGFLQEEIEALKRTVWTGLRAAIDSGDTETIRRVRLALERGRNEVRDIIAGNEATPAGRQA